MNPFGHIDLRVADLSIAQPFYDELLPARLEVYYRPNGL
jgi:hypothetical protein